MKFNGLISYFPVGTFIVNIVGTIVLGACWDLQRAPLTDGAIGGGRVGCQVLQGVQDGFCGCVTTVSTWAIESKGLQRKHAYFFGAMSVTVGLFSLVIIMGTLVWQDGIGLLCVVYEYDILLGLSSSLAGHSGSSDRICCFQHDLISLIATRNNTLRVLPRRSFSPRLKHSLRRRSDQADQKK